MYVFFRPWIQEGSPGEEQQKCLTRREGETVHRLVIENRRGFRGFAPPLFEAMVGIELDYRYRDFLVIPWYRMRREPPLGAGLARRGASIRVKN